jgi:hypothetical protein
MRLGRAVDGFIGLMEQLFFLYGRFLSGHFLYGHFLYDHFLYRHFYTVIFHTAHFLYGSLFLQTDINPIKPSTALHNLVRLSFKNSNASVPTFFLKHLISIFTICI